MQVLGGLLRTAIMVYRSGGVVRRSYRSGSWVGTAGVESRKCRESSENLQPASHTIGGQGASEIELSRGMEKSELWQNRQIQHLVDCEMPRRENQRPRQRLQGSPLTGVHLSTASSLDPGPV